MKLKYGLLVIVILLFQNLISQTLIVCNESSFTGYDLFEADNTPTGRRTKGKWINTDGLEFSNIDDPNTLITVPKSLTTPTTVTLTWSYQYGLSICNFEVSVVNVTNPSNAPDLLSNSSTNDLSLIIKENIDFTVSENDAHNFQYWLNQDFSGNNRLVSSSSSNSLTLYKSEYNFFDKIFSIVTYQNGCKYKTNEIQINEEEIPTTIENEKNIDLKVVVDSEKITISSQRINDKAVRVSVASLNGLILLDKLFAIHEVKGGKIEIQRNQLGEGIYIY